RKRHLDEGLRRARRSAEWTGEGPPELPYGCHHREQRRRRPSLLFLRAVDPGRRDQPSLVPALLAHAPPKTNVEMMRRDPRLWWLRAMTQRLDSLNLAGRCSDFGG